MSHERRAEAGALRVSVKKVIVTMMAHGNFSSPTRPAKTKTFKSLTRCMAYD